MIAQGPACIRKAGSSSGRSAARWAPAVALALSMVSLAGCPGEVPHEGAFGVDSGGATGADGAGVIDVSSLPDATGDVAPVADAPHIDTDAGPSDGGPSMDVASDGGGCDPKKCPANSNPCLVAICSGGICDWQAAADGVDCDDGDACESDKTCQGGQCKGLTVDCADTSPCTLDLCQAGSGCAHPIAPDGTACGGGKVCLGGACGNLPAGWAKGLAAGNGHTCAINTAGKVWCWGNNALGQLGAGHFNGPVAKPVPIDSSASYKLLSSHWEHTCGVQTGGSLTCWGDNAQGATGAPTVGLSSPAGVPGVPAPSAISAGRDFTCAVDKDQKAWCWGAGVDGQLGDGQGVSSKAPVATKLDKPKLIAAGGKHACATAAYGVHCWGQGGHGQLGDGSVGAAITAKQPVTVSGINYAIDIVSGDKHSCLLIASKVVFCWGANDLGQCGTGSGYQSHSMPSKVTALVEPTAIAAGRAHSCAIASGSGAGDSVWCWGDGGSGQLGHGKTVGAKLPVEVEATWTPAALALGQDHSCALDTKGRVWCWGRNDSGQLATTAVKHSATPVLVAAP